MRKTALVCGIALVCLLGPAVPAAHAGVKDLLGKWQLIAVTTKAGRAPLSKEVKIISEFKTGGKLLVHFAFRGKSSVQRGTYKVNGNRLRLTSGKDTEWLTYRRKGMKLWLVNAGRNETSELHKR